MASYWDNLPPEESPKPEVESKDYWANLPPEQPVVAQTQSEQPDYWANLPPEQPTPSTEASDALRSAQGLDKFAPPPYAMPPPKYGPVVPKLRTEEWQPPQPQVESSAAGSFLRGAGMSTLPLVTGIAASRPGAALGVRAAVGLGARLGVGGGPAGIAAGATLGGLAAMMGGAWIGDKIQQWALPKILGEETKTKLDAQLRADIAQHKTAATLGSMLPQAVAFRPSTEQITSIAKLIRGVSQLGWKEYAASPQAQQQLIGSANALFGAGTPVAQDVIAKMRGEDVNAKMTVLKALTGIIFSKDTPVSRALMGTVAKANRTTPAEVQKQVETIAKEIEVTPTEKAAETLPTIERLPGESQGAYLGRQLELKGKQEILARAQEIQKPSEPAPLEAQIRESETATPTPVNEAAELELSLAPRTGKMAETRLPARTAATGTTPREVSKRLVESGATIHPQATVADRIEWAKQQIAKSPEAAERRVMSGERSQEVVEMGAQLRDQYRRMGMPEKEAEITTHVGDVLLEMGRGINAAKSWYSGLSPEGFMSTITRDAQKRGYEYTPEQLALIRREKDVLDKMPESQQKADARQNLLDTIVALAPRSSKAWDFLTAYRYTNMLSSPRATQRNVFNNALNAFVTRPLSLVGSGKFGDAARWWNDIGTGWDRAKSEFSNAMKDAATGKWIEGEPIPEGVQGAELQATRERRLPWLFKVVPRFMSAQDKFFGTLISAGEKIRLERSGMRPEEAQLRGNTLAEKYMLRSKLGDKKDVNPFVRAVDSLGSVAENISNQKGLVGLAAKWMVPFIRTPTNAAKLMLETTPLGLINKKLPKNMTPKQRQEVEYLIEERKGRAIIGSIAMATGAAWAFSGDNTTWTAPTDQRTKELWYATGRKPFSMRVGNQWIPMWYLGPFALAVAVPAALKYNRDERKTKYTDSDGIKLARTIQGAARFLGSQTSTTSVENFFSIMSGQEDVTAEKALTFSGSQMIPFSGLVRYLNTIMDPTFRRTKTAKDTLYRDIPGLSAQLEPYLDPDGKEAKRNWTDWLLPYTITPNDKRYEKVVRGIQESKAQEAIAREKESQAESQRWKKQ